MIPRSILIADDDRALVEVLAIRCRTLRIEVFTAYDAKSAIEAVHRHRPAVICLDVNMPSGSGLGVCESLSADEQFSSTPVIIMTGDAAPETIRRCHSLCAFYIEKGWDVWHRLEPLLRELLPSAELPAPKSSVAPAPPAAKLAPTKIEPSETHRSEPREIIDVVFDMLGTDLDFLDRDASQTDSSPPWILCVDDDADYSNALRKRLELHGVAVLRAFEGMEGFRFASTRPANVILLDYELPNGQGDYILDRLKRNVLTADIPVIMITGRRDKSLKQRMLNMGAANYFTKPPDMEALVKELRRHIDILPKPCRPWDESDDRPHEHTDRDRGTERDNNFCSA
jgi:DNA-binding response OmpR family regulator